MTDENIKIHKSPKAHYLTFKHLHEKAEKNNKMTDERWKAVLTNMHTENTIKCPNTLTNVLSQTNTLNIKMYS